MTVFNLLNLSAESTGFTSRWKPLDFIGFDKLIFIGLTPRFGGRAVLNTTSSALATSRGGYFHAVLPHALQEQIDGTDRNNKQGDRYKRN
jgi:hypothetical protein